MRNDFTKCKDVIVSGQTMGKNVEMMTEVIVGTIAVVNQVIVYT
jgi:hypothetical protein